MNKTYLLIVLTGLLACGEKKRETRDPGTTEVANTSFSEANEKKEILNVIETETACFFKRDYDCWKNQFAHTSYAFQAWNNSDGSVDAKTGWDEIDKRSRDYLADPAHQSKNDDMGQEYSVKEKPASHPSVIRKNMIVKFFTPALAYLVWDQYNSDPARKIYTYSKETRIMEQINGRWKIVHVAAFWDYRNMHSSESVQ